MFEERSERERGERTEDAVSRDQRGARHVKRDKNRHHSDTQSQSDRGTHTVLREARDGPS
eukprot:scaffold4408_cov143-Isochrysis_galbana.AAC.4